MNVSEAMLSARKMYEDYLSERTENPGPDELRRRFLRLTDQFTVPSEADVDELDVGGVRCHRVRWTPIPPERTVVWLHAGGFIFGSARSYQSLGAALAQRARAEVIIVDHRLAPEHRFPAALEDVLAVYRTLVRSDGSAEAVMIAGDSSGGGLAVSSALAAREEGLPLPGALALVSPWVDLAVTGSTIGEDTGFDPQVTRAHMQNMAAVYLNGADPYSPRASPLYGNLAGLPPMLVLASGRDKLLDDALRFAIRAGEARVPVTLRVEPEAMHLWPLFHEFLPEGQRALDDIASVARRNTRRSS